MDFYDAVRSRFSVRSYQDRPVEREVLTRILDAARSAPSAKNLQECRYVVVTDAHKRRELAEAACGQRFVASAPVVIACCSVSDRSTMSCGHARYTIDSGIAIEHLSLAAAAEGLGSCWIGAFSPEMTRRILGIPGSVEVVELLTIGHPAPDAKPMKTKKPLAELVCYESWSLEEGV